MEPVVLATADADVARAGSGCHCWPGPAPHAARVTGVPAAGAVPASRHRPASLMVPAGVAAHCWDRVFRQRVSAASAGWLPDAGSPARHSPGIPGASGPGGSVQACRWMPAQPARVIAVPLSGLIFGSVRHWPVWALARPPCVVCCQI